MNLEKKLGYSSGPKYSQQCDFHETFLNIGQLKQITMLNIDAGPLFVLSATDNWSYLMRFFVCNFTWNALIEFKYLVLSRAQYSFM